MSIWECLLCFNGRTRPDAHRYRLWWCLPPLLSRVLAKRRKTGVPGILFQEPDIYDPIVCHAFPSDAFSVAWCNLSSFACLASVRKGSVSSLMTKCSLILDLLTTLGMKLITSKGHWWSSKDISSGAHGAMCCHNEGKRIKAELAVDRGEDNN